MDRVTPDPGVRADGDGAAPDPSERWTALTRQRVDVLVPRLLGGLQPAALYLEFRDAWGVSRAQFTRLVAHARGQIGRDLGDGASHQLRGRALSIAERVIESAFDPDNRAPRLDPALRAAELICTIANDLESRKQTVHVIHSVEAAREQLMARITQLSAPIAPALAAPAPTMPVFEADFEDVAVPAAATSSSADDLDL